MPEMELAHQPFDQLQIWKKLYSRDVPFLSIGGCYGDAGC